MMDTVATLGRTLGFSLAAGVNVYATVALLGLSSRYGWVQLPEQFAVFSQTWIIVLACALYVVEFFADKIPWFDSAWDALHTFIRPIGAALVSVTALGAASPFVAGLVALLSAGVAASSHLTKASTRVAANTSPEPISNWLLSLTEDVAVIALTIVTMKFPVVALVVSVAMLIAIVVVARKIWRWASRPR